MAGLRDLLRGFERTNDSTARKNLFDEYEEGYIDGYDNGYDDGSEDTSNRQIGAIADGLRMGSSKCGQEMANRRWKNNYEKKDFK